jgi:hypothetical protein
VPNLKQWPDWPEKFSTGAVRLQGQAEETNLLLGKGCSGLCRKAFIGRRVLITRSHLEVLFCLERHPGRMSRDLKISLKPTALTPS